MERPLKAVKYYCFFAVLNVISTISPCCSNKLIFGEHYMGSFKLSQVESRLIEFTTTITISTVLSPRHQYCTWQTLTNMVLESLIYLAFYWSFQKKKIVMIPNCLLLALFIIFNPVLCIIPQQHDLFQCLSQQF